MAFFDFLKKLSGKKTDSQISIEELTLSEAESRLDSLSKEKLSNLKAKLQEKKEELAKEKLALDNALAELSTAELKNQAIPEKAKQLMEGNRQTYIQKLKDFNSKINFPESSEETLKFAENLDREFDAFDKSIARNHLIMEEFFGKKASAITQIMKNLDKQIKDAGKIASDEEMKNIILLKNLVLELKNKTERKNSFRKNIESLEKAVSEQTSEINSKEKNIEELKKGETFTTFKDHKKEKELTEKELKETETKLLHTFSEIEPALKKYENLSGNKIAASYLSNPLKALQTDDSLEIAQILNSAEKALQTDEIILKDKKKDKIAKELYALNKEYFQTFLEKTQELNKKINSLASKIEESEVSKQVLKAEDELSRKRIELKERRLELHEAGVELEKINLQNFKEKLSEEFSSVFENKIKII